jgi:hypothetical protein
MSRLLGPLPSGAAYLQENGQLALRFLGDMCADGDPNEVTPASFEAQRLGWAGLAHRWAAEPLRARTHRSHFGEIHNVDCLVGSPAHAHTHARKRTHART